MKYKSLFNLWKIVCNKYDKKIAFFDNKSEQKISYMQAFREVCFLAHNLDMFGFRRFDTVSFFISNNPRWLIIEEAVITLGGIIAAKSPEVNKEELDYVYNESNSSVVITDNIDILNFFIKKDNLKFILYSGEGIIKPQSAKVYILNDILKNLNDSTPLKTDWEDYPDDIAYISYTSGTSSKPKGAMLKNISMVRVIEALEEVKEVNNEKSAIVTCHISSMGWKAENLIYWALGCTTIYTHYREFYETIEKFRPSYFEIPPKILQTIHTKLLAKIEEKGHLFQVMFNSIYAFSEKLLFFERKHKMLKSFTESINNFLDKLFYKKIRSTMFADELLMDVGSAPLPKKIEDFYTIIGIPIVQSYGATETTGIVIGNTVKSQKEHPYSVGIPFNCNTIKIVNPDTKEELKNGNSGLLLIKGPTIMSGYHNNEEATKKALLDDGFYNTGDICSVDKDGFISIISRCDDVIVLTNGYNIYTRLLENEVKDSEFINHFVIVGHGKPYLTAIVVPDFSQKMQTTNSKEFLLNHINEKIKKKNDYKYYEKIKDIYICKDDFTVENNLLTANTLKIKYSEVYKKYKKEIDKMY